MSLSKLQTSLVPVPPSFDLTFVTVSKDKEGKRKEKFTKGLISYQTLFGGDNLYTFSAILSYGTKVISLYTFVINKLGKIEVKPNHNSLFKDNAYPLSDYQDCKSGYEYFIKSLESIENMVDQPTDLGYLIYAGLLEHLDIDPKTGNISGYSPSLLKEVCTDLLNVATVDNLPFFVFVNANKLPEAKVIEETQTADDNKNQ